LIEEARCDLNSKEENPNLSKRNLLLSAFLGVLSSLTLAGMANGQASSTPVPVTLIAHKPESVSVTLTSASTVNFALNGTITAGDVSPAWTTTWNLFPTSSPVTVCVYLTGDLTGTGGNTDTIPPANILGQPEGTGAFTALTGTACGQSNGLQINSVAINGSNKSGSANDSVALEINEASPALTLSADTYSGTLNIIAQAP
jgi:hypothetical protein